ncbi:MAG: formimidoylglutamate deiminase [Crocinitomix sp.]|nr:formimidoylglutamate deiminase [Crocinitomix sp.]
MKTYKVKGLLTGEGFSSNVCVRTDDNGIISSIDTNSEDLDAQQLNVYALPGFQNAHSHAFQYAMAGLAERHATNQTPDDFWSWREAMYQLALTISPDDLENIAAMLYAEMLRHGYTNVAEFHYVHHDKAGAKYANLSEMGERLVAAAKRVGIGITLVPIFYQKGGFGKAPTAGQRRFISKDLESYLELLSASEKSTQLYEHANLAIGIHSMRGVEPSVIAELAKDGPQNSPFHIHISEQLKETEDSIAYLGKRPVEWMLENVEMNDRFHFVHATHLTDAETDGIAKSGANVVLCPTTEGNLGDGIFPLRRFQDQGGKWSIGTDSHIGINPFEELRLLDYGQRLISHKRNTFYSKEQGDSGLYAYEQVTSAGRKAMNNYSKEYFKVGDYFNAVLIDANAPLIASSSLDNLASTILYCTDASMQYGTISHGKLIVKNGRHQEEDRIRANFVKTMHALGSRR